MESDGVLSRTLSGQVLSSAFPFFLRTDTGILKVTSTHLPAVPVDNFCQVPAGFSYSFLNIYKRQERFENEGLPDKKNFDIFASIANH